MTKIRNFFLVLLIFFTTLSISRAQEKEIVFAISPMSSPASNLSMYHDFIKYLSKKIGYKLVIKQRRKYSEINSLLETGEAQFALTSTGAFLSGRDDFGLKVLAVPVMFGTSSYNSYIIVNKSSKIENFSQLKGKVFVFTDPISLSGRLYPLHLFKVMGIKPNGFFKKTFYTSSHEKSIESVANGLADGAAVDSHIYDGLERRGAPFIERLKIIQKSPPFGIQPIVASPLSDKTVEQRIVRALMKMRADPEGREVLDRIEIEKFIMPDPAIYRTAEKMRKSVLLP